MEQQENSNASLDIKINNLKKNFNKIKETRDEIKRIFEVLSNKIIKLKSIYNEIVNENKNTVFVFGLDSFNFQTKLIDTEYNQMITFYKLLCNRLYCDYYRLYSIINNYVLNDIRNSKTNNTPLMDKLNSVKYEKYDYIHTEKVYPFENVCLMFTDIISLIISLNEKAKSNTLDLKNYKTKVDSGLNLNNFIHTFTYQNSVLNDKLILYINYVDFFLNLHTKYYTRFITKLKIMYGQINHDIQLDDTTFSKKKQKKQFIKEIKRNISPNNTSIMKEIKESFEDIEDNEDTEQTTTTESDDIKFSDSSSSSDSEDNIKHSNMILKNVNHIEKSSIIISKNDSTVTDNNDNTDNTDKLETPARKKQKLIRQDTFLNKGENINFADVFDDSNGGSDLAKKGLEELLLSSSDLNFEVNSDNVSNTPDIL